MSPVALSALQQETLDAYHRYEKKHGQPPSTAELAGAMKVNVPAMSVRMSCLRKLGAVPPSPHRGGGARGPRRPKAAEPIPLPSPAALSEEVRAAIAQAAQVFVDTCTAGLTKALQDQADVARGAIAAEHAALASAMDRRCRDQLCLACGKERTELTRLICDPCLKRSEDPDALAKAQGRRLA